MKHKSCLIVTSMVFTAFFSGLAFAVEPSDFQCRKLPSTQTLAELKASLVENCNLKLPFSFTQSGIGVGGSGNWVYCCHTKASSTKKEE